MLKIENVPYRIWNSRGSLVDAKDGKRVMALMGREMKAGRAVQFVQHPPTNPTAPDKLPAVYDTISLHIMD